jgi:glycosyltransferase involved in cell wall biosynthesis
MTKVILSANTDWYLYNFRFSLAKFLRDQGFEVILSSPPGNYHCEFAKEGFRWFAWNLGRQTLAPWKETSSFLQIARIYRRERPDLVHHHTIKPVLYGSLTARLLGVNNVVNSITGRGYVFWGQELKARLLRQVVRRMYRLAFSHPNFAAVFENDDDRKYFVDQNFIPAERTWLVAGVGVDPKRFMPVSEPPGAPVVILSGRMLWDKGVGVLVDAARILHKNRQVRVALVGEPDPGNPASIDPSVLKAWVQEGVVEWWGWQADMRQVYAHSHIVTAPTLFGEGIPTVLLEAAACGRPIVGTDTPGCRDIAIDGLNGFLIPPNDPVALANALDRLISDRDLRGRMGAAGRQLVLEKFTTGKVNAGTLRIYRRVLGPG